MWVSCRCQPFDLCSVPRRHLISVLDGDSVAFNDVSFFSYNGVRVVEKCGRCSFNRYYIWDAVLVYEVRELLHAHYENDPYALSVNLYFGLSVVLEIFLFTASGGLSTNDSWLVSTVYALPTRLLYSEIYRIGMAVNCLSVSV